MNLNELDEAEIERMKHESSLTIDAMHRTMMDFLVSVGLDEDEVFNNPHKVASFLDKNGYHFIFPSKENSDIIFFKNGEFIKGYRIEIIDGQAVRTKFDSY